MESWKEPYGDRRQELVFIGSEMDAEQITADLEECLLTDEEMALGVDAWGLFDDPFPVWELAAR